MGLTVEQQDIVEAGDTDIAVSAGAGSGKTHVLVERYVALLERCAIPEIVAVTFTEAAAAEMRQRVRREVMTRPALDPHRPHVDDAVIGTIHSLCLRLLREYPVEAGLDPTASILAEDEAELLRRIACTQAVDAAAEAGDGRTDALRAIGVYQAGQMLPSMVSFRDDVRSAFAALPQDAEAIAAHIRTVLDTACADALDPLRSSVPDGLEAVQTQMLDPADLLAVRLLEAMGAIGDSREGAVREWAGRLAAAADAIKLTGGRAAAWAMSVGEIRNDLRAVRDSIQQALSQVALWNDADEACALAMPGLRALFEDACARYAAAKQERHTLDFLDLEETAVRLLADHPEVAAACQRRYRHVMVDEAQDVSPIQARLIRLLVGSAAGRPRLFLVGDEKQSIYGFRGADVRQFRELRDLVRGWGGLSRPLSASFRTHASLVGRMNELFQHAFEASAVTMEQMTGRPSDPPPGPHLVLMPLATPDRNGPMHRLVEADMVASEIRSLLDSGRLIWDKRAEAYRPVRPGDVAILLRRYSNVHTFEQALDAHGIPFATPSGTGFFSRQEVVDLSNLLRWLAEPDDEIALVGALRSPLFILRDDTLLALRARRPLLGALDPPPPGLDAAEQARCTFAAEVLRALRRSARTAAAHELLEQALEATAFEASWAAVSGGEQVLANIRKLVRLCRGLAGYTLAEVVDYLAQRRDDLDAREGPAVLDRPDAVQVMTVHGAKGLEFPVVFVPEAHLPARTGWEAVRWRTDEGISFTLERAEGDDQRPRPGFYSLLARRDEVDEGEEHRRLFYVAATRAGDYLYLSGDEAGSKGWLQDAIAARDAGALRDIESRAAVIPDAVQVARRPAPHTVAVPDAAAELDYTPDLLQRPPVIPLRTSTPVTSLRLTAFHQWGYGDGLGLVRGRIVHRVIEARYAAPNSFSDATIEAIVAEEAAVDLDTRTVLAEEARGMLDRFAASEAGRGAAAPESRGRFEMPFAWDWDGVPVHGQIDLLYRDAASGEWCVVDFKTDRVVAGHEAEAAEPYLVQIGLYAKALEAATGKRPRASLLFLRSGTSYEPPWPQVEAALAAARREIDAGLVLDPAPLDYLGDEEP